MRKITILLSFLFFIGISFANAQTRTISGKVTGASDGMGLPGVTVQVQGTTIGTVTDIDGNYTLDVTPDAESLVFKYVGMKTVVVTIGDQKTIFVSLETDAVMMGEVVVTALGISREKKSLGYAVQEVDGEELTKAKDANFINSLSGKVAGVSIKRSTQMGGSSNVIIRGETSLYGNNQALFVVDGTPISNTIDNSRDQQTGRGGYDYGNAAMDINPEDIESVSILRGAAATALYGSIASNGVIMITTKKGHRSALGDKSKNLGVSFSTGYTSSSVDKSTLPRYQEQYGAGYSTIQGWYPDPDGFEYFDFGDGQHLSANVYEDASFGPEFNSDLMVYNWESYFPELDNYGKLLPYVHSPNDANTFWEQGRTWNTNLSINGGTEKGTYRLSYTNFDQTGNLPNSSIKKNTFSFSGDYDVTDKFSASSSVSYIVTDAMGRYGTGYDNRNVNQSFRQWYAVGTDFERQWATYDQTGKNISWNPYGPLAGPTLADAGSHISDPHYFDNYYFNRYENYQNDSRHRIIGNVALSYEFTPWLSLTTRVSLDRFDELREERIAVGSIDVAKYDRDNKSFSVFNYDLYASFNKYFDKLSVSGDLGLNLRRTSLSSMFASTNGGLVVPEIYALSNSLNPIEAPEETVETIATDGYYARVSFGYNNFLFLDLTGRYDVSSTLPEDNNSYFYPSASISWVFSEQLNVDAISFSKVRFNYAEVGAGTDAHAIMNTFDLNTPFSGVPLASASNTLKNSELKPERTKSFEAGLEMMFLKNRLGFDFSIYKANSYDQIMPVAVSGATGSLFKYVNAGNIQNQGIELAVNATIIKNKNFFWRLDLSWAKNQNEVIELYEDQTNIQLASVQGGVTINATVGEPYGAIWGTNFEYDDNGEKIVYPHWNGGMRWRKTSDPEVIGNITPDWRGGVTNTLGYKNLSLGFLIDIQKGGNFFSLDTWYGYATGIYDFTAGNNDLGNPVRALPADGGGLPIGGVLHATDANGDFLYDDDGRPISNGEVNTEYGYASDVYSSFGYVYAPNAYHVYDATFVKLRELTLTYTLPSRILEKTFIDGIDVSLVGRNLWIIHKNSEYSDPEAGLSAGRYRGNQSGAYPSVREYGFNLRFRF